MTVNLLGLYGLLIGLIGSVYVVKGFLAKRLEDIIAESCEGRAIGNIYLAKSLIQQKWEIIIGFIWLAVSYIMQMAAQIASPSNIPKNHLIFLAIVVLFIFVSEKRIKALRLKDACTFVLKQLTQIKDVKQTAPLKTQGTYLDSYALFGQIDPEFVKEICDLLLIKEVSGDREENMVKINLVLNKYGKRLALPSGALAWQKLDE